MEKRQKSIKSFTDLKAWQEGHKLAVDIYKSTKNFPKEELFGLTAQLRRAVVSFTSNIAEGFSRYFDKEKLRFYHMALGSLTEIQNQLLIARDVKYIDVKDFDRLSQQTVTASKLTNGLIKSTRDRNS